MLYTLMIYLNFQVLENLIENSFPYLKYSYKKYKAVQ
jgi:hypothetical protein